MSHRYIAFKLLRESICAVKLVALAVKLVALAVKVVALAVKVVTVAVKIVAVHPTSCDTTPAALDEANPLMVWRESILQGSYLVISSQV